MIWDLVKFLPIREKLTMLEEAISPIPESEGIDDVKFFLDRNPGLYYHSSSMVDLLTASALCMEVGALGYKSANAIIVLYFSFLC